MTDMDLQAEIRTDLGKAAAKGLRKKGLTLGEVYGHGAANVHVSIPAKDFLKILKAAGETSVITLHAGDEKIPAMIQDVVRDSLSGVVSHADFRRVNMNEKIFANVPVEFVGQSSAVKGGGVLVKAVSEIEVEALPAHMPRTIVIDLALLTEIGQSLHVKDAVMGAGVRANVILHMAPEAVVATVIAPRSDEEQMGDARTVEDVKVETEEAKAARDKEKADKSVEKE
jgi:large subunit ribosomal protein L25